MKINVKYQDIPLKQLKEERLKDYRAQQSGENPDIEASSEPEVSEETEPMSESGSLAGKEMLYPYTKRILLAKVEYADGQKDKIFNKIGLLLSRIPAETKKYDEQIDKMLQDIMEKQKRYGRIYQEKE